jgi:hypothetical protein
LDGNAMETFSLGDTIRVELDLRDESGLSTVSIAFYELDEGKGFMMLEQNALELLHAIREHHPDIYAGAWVNPYTAALEAGP